MEQEYFIGQIFEEMYPVEASDWANDHQAQLIEIEPAEVFHDGIAKVVRRFRMSPLYPETEAQKQLRMLTIRDHYFAEYVDWYQSKPLLWSELTKAEKDDIKAYRIYLKDYNNTEQWWEHEPLDFETWKESQ